MNRFLVQALQGKDSLFPRNDLSTSRFPLISVPACLAESIVRTFVAILLSGTPAAVNQLVVTQLYNPEGSAHTLASFLMLQCKFGIYTLEAVAESAIDVAMPVLSTALAAIALYVTEKSVS